MKYSNIQSTEGNEYAQVQNERELRKNGDESNKSASDKSGSREKIAVDSIKRVQNSSLQSSVKKN